jgi:hypothetical protein
MMVTKRLSHFFLLFEQQNGGKCNFVTFFAPPRFQNTTTIIRGSFRTPEIITCQIILKNSHTTPFCEQHAIVHSGALKSSDIFQLQRTIKLKMDVTLPIASLPTVWMSPSIPGDDIPARFAKTSGDQSHPFTAAIVHFVRSGRKLLWQGRRLLCHAAAADHFRGRHGVMRGARTHCR